MIAQWFSKHESAESGVNCLIEQMTETGKNAGVKALCMEDMLIIEFAKSLLYKLGTEDERKRKDKDNIRMKL